MFFAAELIFFYSILSDCFLIGKCLSLIEKLLSNFKTFDEILFLIALCCQKLKEHIEKEELEDDILEKEF